MVESTARGSARTAAEARIVRLLSAIFFFSGFAALVYQVVWQRLLTVYYGVGAISTTLIVSVYMLGLGVGALAGGVLADRVRRRIGLYAVVELAIALFGLISLWLLEFLGVRTAGSPYALALVYVAAFFCVPTFLMGATLPILTKIFNQSIRDFLSTVSTLYFLNTIGAALGALLGSYLLISFFGLDLALYVAVATNFTLAGLIFYARSISSESPVGAMGDEPVDPAAGSLGRAAFVVVFLTGFLAIGYEIVWFRVIEILTKNSPYSFSTVLATYLLGIALGSYLIRRWWRRLAGIHKKDRFFALQFAIGAS
jgi:predicted membrane-bound spermidine synthase